MDFSEIAYQLLFQNMINAFAYHRIILDDNGNPVDYEFLEVNDVFESFMGIPREQILGKRVLELIPDLSEEAFDWIGYFGEIALHCKTDTFEQYSEHLKKWFRLHCFSTQRGYFSALFMDITELKERELELVVKNQQLTQFNEKLLAYEEDLRRQLEMVQKHQELMAIKEARYRTLVNNSQDMIYSCDCEGRITAVNDEFCRRTGLTHGEAIGVEMLTVIADAGYRFKWLEAFETLMENRESIQFEYELVSEARERLFYVETLSPIFTNEGSLVGITGTSHDITSLKRNEKLIRYMAYHDELTGLPNRALFVERLNTSLMISSRYRKKVAVIFLDLDDFKKVNDLLGHSVGDEILLNVAKRLQGCIRPLDTVARLSGDKFLILIQNVDTTQEVIDYLREISRIFHEPFDLNRDSYNITASMGVAIFPEDGKTVEDLIKSADTAMYKAKELGRDRYQLYNYKMKEELQKKVNIERLLREAIKNGEFFLCYQPQINLRDGSIRGFEALIRWKSPILGPISPLEFIPIAEETGLILPIGKWVLEQAARLCKHLQEQYREDLIVSVNISTIQLREQGFYDMVMEAIGKAGISPGSLELEVTESTFIQSYEHPVKVLQRLREQGIRIALDDFGTGYSSLSYLRYLPIDLLKIDKAFIDEIDADNPQGALADSIIALVHKLNIETLAEGIENRTQYEYLVKARCGHIQGYYISKPMPEEEINRFMDQSCQL